MKTFTIACCVLAAVRAQYDDFETDTRRRERYEAISRTGTVRHAFGIDSQFETRGEVMVKGDKQGKTKVTLKQQEEVHGDYRLSNDEIEKIKGLIETDDFYRLQIEMDGKKVTTGIKACDLHRGNFKEEIFLVLQETTGDVLSIDYRSPISPLAKPCKEKKFLDSPAIKTKIVVRKINANVEGVPLAATTKMVPPELKEYKIKSEGGADAENQQGYQSFLSKYWYIILPVSIIMLSGGGAHPEGPPGAQGGASGSGGQRRAAR